MQKYMLALTAFLMPVLMSAPAYASELGDRPGGGRYDFLTSTMDDLVDIMGQVWSVMVSNPLFLVFLGAGLFSVGIWIYRKVKGAAKR